MRRAELVWVDNVDGLGWVMDRLIDLARNANNDQFVLIYVTLLKARR